MSDRRLIRPDNNLLVKYYLYLLIAIVFFVLPGYLLALVPDVSWTFVIIYTLANLIWIAPVAVLIPLYYRTIEYEMAEDEVIVRRGLITKTETTVPYRTVTNIDVKEGPLDRLLGIGSLKIQTAGYSQQTNAEASLVGVRGFVQLQAELRTALRRYRARSGQAVAVEELPEAAPGASGAALSDALLRDILAEVRALRQAVAERGNEEDN